MNKIGKKKRRKCCWIILLCVPNILSTMSRWHNMPHHKQQGCMRPFNILVSPPTRAWLTGLLQAVCPDRHIMFYTSSLYVLEQTYQWFSLLSMSRSLRGKYIYIYFHWLKLLVTLYKLCFTFPYIYIICLRTGTYHWYLCDYSITYWLLSINEVRFKLNKGNKNINILGKQH